MSTQGVLIGISGASGSGKTLVARTLYDSLGSEKVVIIQEDAYYKDLAELSLEERTKINFDHPDAFDHSLLIQQVNELINGRSIEHPVYDFTKHTRKPEFRTVGPHSIVILEGILILAIPELRDLMDIKIFVDTPADICFIRRLERDIRDRERTVESVIQQYQKTVRPMIMQFFDSIKLYADIIIPHGGKNIIAIDIIQAKIENLLQNQR